jgi:hypothetical protein
MKLVKIKTAVPYKSYISKPYVPEIMRSFSELYVYDSKISTLHSQRNEEHIKFGKFLIPFNSESFLLSLLNTEITKV